MKTQLFRQIAGAALGLLLATGAQAQSGNASSIPAYYDLVPDNPARRRNGEEVRGPVPHPV